MTTMTQLKTTPPGHWKIQHQWTQAKLANEKHKHDKRWHYLNQTD
jgi:hypothetical protein